MKIFFMNSADFLPVELCSFYKTGYLTDYILFHNLTFVIIYTI